MQPSTCRDTKRFGKQPLSYKTPDLTQCDWLYHINAANMDELGFSSIDIIWTNLLCSVVERLYTLLAPSNL
jgi:hypothetical protein